MKKLTLALTVALAFATPFLFSAWEDFRLETLSVGSELPWQTSMVITPDRHIEIVTTDRGNELSGLVRRITGTLAEADFAALADSLVNGCDFFSLPATAVSPPIMDMATQSVTLTANGKTHKISAYAARMCSEYQGLYKVLDRIGADIPIQDRVEYRNPEYERPR